MPTIDYNIAKIKKAEKLAESDDLESVLKAKKIASEEYSNLFGKKKDFINRTQRTKKIYDNIDAEIERLHTEKDTRMRILNNAASFHLLFLFFFLLGIWRSAVSSDWDVFIFLYLFFAAPCEAAGHYKWKKNVLGDRSFAYILWGYTLSPLTFFEDVFSYFAEKSKIRKYYDAEIEKKLFTRKSATKTVQEIEKRSRFENWKRERENDPEWQCLSEDEKDIETGRKLMELLG